MDPRGEQPDRHERDDDGSLQSRRGRGGHKHRRSEDTDASVAWRHHLLAGVPRSQAAGVRGHKAHAHDEERRRDRLINANGAPRGQDRAPHGRSSRIAVVRAQSTLSRPLVAACAVVAGDCRRTCGCHGGVTGQACPGEGARVSVYASPATPTSVRAMLVH